jgi:hypothetical protein
VPRLHYRELITKTLRDVPFKSLNEMGQRLASYNDIYTCAAKRYYRFFTGVDVLTTSVATDPLDKMHQDNVRSLAGTLKSTQSVRAMLLQLFKTSAFKDSGHLTEKEQ